jgi:serine phosphatase RsbU (regulator of sigma subunit)
MREPELEFSIPVGEPSPLTTAFRERLPITFEGQSARWAYSVFRLFDAALDRSGVVVPLTVGEEVLGVVVVLAAGRHALTDAQTETLRAFAAQAAVALHTSGLFEHERASRMEAEALREVAELVAGSLDLDVALQSAAAIAASLLSMRAGGVAVDDREEFGLPDAAEPELEAALIDLWRTAEAAQPHRASAFEPILLTGRPFGLSAAGLDSEDGSVLLIPLVRADATRGVLALVGDAGSAPSDRKIATAVALGKEVSLALENAALLQEARTRAANLEMVSRISQAVSSSLQINVVLNRVLDVVQKIFSADSVALMSYDAAKRTIVTSMARGVANREMLYYEVTPGDDIPGTVFSTHEPVSAPDLRELHTPLSRLAADQGLLSMVAVPLLARGRSIGVLTAYDSRAGAFSHEDVELLLTFASQAALAIDTAALYGKEHHVASVLQASILPERLPDIPGLESDSFYLPAGSEAEIGGDYYDLFAMPDGTVVIAIADVCGKGVLAATKTSMIKYMLRGMVSAGAEPADALAELNRVVSTTGDPSDILTAWVGFLDPDRRTLRYANGGHPPALLRRFGGGRVERLSSTGPLLGAIGTSTYAQRTVAFGLRDLLITYTDGVVEARSGKKFFGEGRIRRVMLHSRTATEVVDGLLEAVSAFSAGVMRDDAAVLVVRMTGDSSDGLGGDVTGTASGVDSLRTGPSAPANGQSESQTT